MADSTNDPLSTPDDVLSAVIAIDAASTLIDALLDDLRSVQDAPPPVKDVELELKKLNRDVEKLMMHNFEKTSADLTNAESVCNAGGTVAAEIDACARFCGRFRDEFRRWRYELWPGDTQWWDKARAECAAELRLVSFKNGLRVYRATARLFLSAALLIYAVGEQDQLESKQSTVAAQTGLEVKAAAALVAGNSLNPAMQGYEQALVHVMALVERRHHGLTVKSIKLRQDGTSSIGIQRQDGREEDVELNMEGVSIEAKGMLGTFTQNKLVLKSNGTSGAVEAKDTLE